ncbi:alpha/beta fold hydrolase [Aestuariicoccus sp. MJ-SS9]|uniref:alpha/beta fold hydrolase n=1 Tax=Aestuariicoccus sp. MJ-SS9 TaxID=3079855 RepID=UPI00290ADCD7|nr:alpha/beta fold hydrolase [Aestuariicoccus sp. MJ-SS9]MDU8914080.1 alpha/beta fold hydrolase [Aestuariicoccus sp. MJ-SS9]
MHFLGCGCFMQDRLRIEVLGNLRLRVAGKNLQLPPSKKTRALISYLAVSGRAHTRDHLCNLLWEGPADPRASLRWSVHKLRQALARAGLDCIRSDSESVSLDPDAIELDFREVQKLDLANASLSELENGAGKFRGRFLAGLDLPLCERFEAWRTYHSTLTLSQRSGILRALAERLRETDPERAEYFRMMSSGLGTEIESHDTAVPRATGRHQAAGCPYESAPESDERPKAPALHFCRADDGVRIAYSVAGSGLPILRSAHWMSHLQYEWESPVWRHWITALSERTSLIRYDQRGNGLSDWDVPDMAFDRMVHDLERVVDAAGLGRFALLGVSQSCPISIEYAVRHPEKVRCLILYGGFAKGWRMRGDPHSIASHEAMTTLIREGWGQDNPAFRRMFTELLIPGAQESDARSLDDLQRRTVSPENAARLHEAFGRTDVEDRLAQVTVPTLVAHVRRDAMVPFSCGLEIAAGIPGARFLELDSENHILAQDEPAFDEFVREVLSFVEDPRQAAPLPRV